MNKKQIQGLVILMTLIAFYEVFCELLIVKTNALTITLFFLYHTFFVSIMSISIYEALRKPDKKDICKKRFA